jgi:hypothetical protein
MQINYLEKYKKYKKKYIELKKKLGGYWYVNFPINNDNYLTENILLDEIKIQINAQFIEQIMLNLDNIYNFYNINKEYFRVYPLLYLLLESININQINQISIADTIIFFAYFNEDISYITGSLIYNQSQDHSFILIDGMNLIRDYKFCAFSSLLAKKTYKNKKEYYNYGSIFLLKGLYMRLKNGLQHRNDINVKFTGEHLYSIEMIERFLVKLILENFENNKTYIITLKTKRDHDNSNIKIYNNELKNIKVILLQVKATQIEHNESDDLVLYSFYLYLKSLNINAKIKNFGILTNDNYNWRKKTLYNCGSDCIYVPDESFINRKVSINFNYSNDINQDELLIQDIPKIEIISYNNYNSLYLVNNYLFEPFIIPDRINFDEINSTWNKKINKLIEYFKKIDTFNNLYPIDTYNSVSTIKINNIDIIDYFLNPQFKYYLTKFSPPTLYCIRESLDSYYCIN